jgi:transcriptional regulator with XRE-family HTH domain
VQDVQGKVGRRIRALRNERGWTQDEFGDKAGLNRAHVGEIERGESNVTIQTLKLIADTLKVKIRDLVEDV